jgi:glycolate oxidase FAD binding subunit
MTDKRSLASSITSIVGAAHVTENSKLKIDGLSPGLIVRPGSAEEVSACMRVCSESDAAVVPAGQMTWLECGNPLRRVDVLLSLDRMQQILEYSPPDLTATVEAGAILSAFNAVTARERQWLPLDPPGFKDASLGAIAACNSSGALRLGFGTPRDYVIGLKLVHADGIESKSGGKVVKNVAGYDLNKLYTGSYGTLAIITELTFKLRPLPARSSTVVLTSQDRPALFQFAKLMLASGLQPASVVLTRRLFKPSHSPTPDDALLIRFTDSEAAVEHQLGWVMEAIDENCRAVTLNDDQTCEAWAEVADFNTLNVRVRLSVPLSTVQAVFEKTLLDCVDSVATVDIGAGIIRLAFDDDDTVADQIVRLRASAVEVNGTLMIEKAPTGVRLAADAWGSVGSTADIMRSVKARFDPQSLLNPGKFVLQL